MKKIIILSIIIFSSFNCYSQSGWSNTGEGLTDTDIKALYSLLLDSTVRTAAGSSDSGKIFITSDGGANWVFYYHQQNGSVTSFELPARPNHYDFVSNPPVLMAGSGGLVAKSTNYGQNWSHISSGTSNDLTSISYLDSSLIYIAGRNGTIIKSSNGGSNWFTQSSGTLSWLQSISFYDANTGWCTGLYTAGGAPVLKTINGGSTWTEIFSSGVSTSYYSIQFINQNTGWICGSANSFGLIMKTTDGGVSWIDQNAPSGKVLRKILFTPNGDTGYCAGALDLSGNTGRILKTTNGGANWISQVLPAGTKDLNNISFINGTTGFAVGRNGTMLKTTSGGEPIGIHQISSEVPRSYSLYQNYPNPFNPSTKIKFDISNNSSNVKLVIYDIQGREITVLVNQNMNAGKYEVDWNAAGMSSGVYFYNLTASSYIETKRMILIK